MQIVAQTIELAKALLNAQSFIHWQRLNTEPCAPLPAKQVGGRAPFDQVCGQHGVNFVLQARALPDQLRAARDLAAQRQRVLIRHPDFRQEATRI